MHRYNVGNINSLNKLEYWSLYVILNLAKFSITMDHWLI